jgi:hypothetical protein
MDGAHGKPVVQHRGNSWRPREGQKNPWLTRVTLAIEALKPCAKPRDEVKDVVRKDLK